MTYQAFSSIVTSYFCGCRITAITPAFQAGDEGSTPFIRLSPDTAFFSLFHIGFVVSLTDSLVFYTELNSYMLIDRLILDNIARDRNIIQVFTARDRVLLLELTQPIFTYIKQTYRAQQFYFHPPSAISFLRVQNPEKFGDELSSFALQIVGKKLAGTVAETNAAAKDAIQIIANLTAARAGAEKNFVEVYESVN